MANNYIRVGVFPVEAVIPFVFTRDTRHRLTASGHDYKSREWKEASRKEYPVKIDNVRKRIVVRMGSHRYQLFATKGIKCIKCGLEGRYFALERNRGSNPGKFHFNLYGIDKDGKEVMMTKDHIIPRSKGGGNKLQNYQPLCYYCNQKKMDKIEDVTS